MSRWAVVIPSPQETNILSNPSFEKDTSGWTAVGATLTRVATQQRRGVYSLSIAPTSGVNDGAYAAVTTTVTPHGFGINVLGVAGIPYLIRWADTSGTLLGTATTFTGTGKWQRVWVGWNESSATTRRVYVSKNNHASTGTFYVDGAKVSAESAESTYFDGDTVGFYAGDYYWLGAAHASQSVRKAYIRHGGRIADFETEFGFLVEGYMGFGLSKIANILLPLALVGGAVFQRQVPQERSAVLVGSFTGSSEQDLQQKRQKAIAALGPNVYSGRDEPVMLLYRAGDGASTQPYLEIPALNEDGLKGGRSKGNTENAAIQFTVYLPYVTKQGNAGAVLTTQTTTAPSGAGLLRRDPDGVWRGSLGTGNIKDFAVGPDGYLYLFGKFTTLNGVTNATGVAKYDPVTHAVTALGTGISSLSYVSAAKFGPDGNLYVCGSFGGAGGVANTAALARWNMTSLAWESIGTVATSAGYGLTVLSIDWDLAGNLWAGGDYYSIDAVVLKSIGYRAGTTWTAAGDGMDAGSSNDAIVQVLSDKRGGMYVYGYFQNLGALTGYMYAAHWNDSTLLWESMGATSSGAYTASAEAYQQADRMMLYGDDGLLYMIGKVWDGTTLKSWSPSGFGGSYQIQKYRGSVACLRSLSTAGKLKNASGGQWWNGSEWEYLLDLQRYYVNDAYYLAGVREYNGTTYAFIYATSEISPMHSNGAVTIVNNGTVPAYPVLKFTGAGRLYTIRNLTTNKRISFNYVLGSSETVTLTLAPGNTSFVNNQGDNLLGYIIPGSDINSFALQPGDNVVTVFADITTGFSLTGAMQWAENYAGIDGGSQ